MQKDQKFMYPIRGLKYKSIPVYVKNKKGVGVYMIISKETIHFKCFQRIEQTKANEEGWDKINKSFKLYNHNKIWFLFPCLFIFHQINC